MKNAHQLFLCMLPVFLSGCGELSYDVSHSRRYQSGGYVPGHILRHKTDAIVIAPTDKPYPMWREGIRTMAAPPPASTRSQRFLQRAAMPHPYVYKVVRRVPESSQLRVHSLRRRMEFLAGFSTLDAIEVRVTVLDGRREDSEPIKIQGDSDLSTNVIGLFGRTTNIPAPNPKYLEDITPHAPAEYR